MSGSAAASVPAVVLGGSGYVAGELLRLLAGHPVFRVAAVVSSSRAGAPVAESFVHLRGTRFDGEAFADDAAVERLVTEGGSLAVFSALPHGEAAVRIDALLALAAASGCAVRVVDLSADFRHRDPEVYAAVYGRPHGAPGRICEFTCTLPELAKGDRPLHVEVYYGHRLEDEIADDGDSLQDDGVHYMVTFNWSF